MIGRSRHFSDVQMRNLPIFFRTGPYPTVHEKKQYDIRTDCQEKTARRNSVSSHGQGDVRNAESFFASHEVLDL